MKRRFFRLGDLVALSVTLLVILLAFFLFSPSEQGDTVYIYADGTLHDTVRLRTAPKDPCTVRTERGEITLLFSEDGVEVTASACPDRVCMRTGKISRVGESIVCAPLGVCITLGEGALDGVTG